jgi:hypothetical protein
METQNLKNGTFKGVLLLTIALAGGVPVWAQGDGAAVHGSGLQPALAYGNLPLSFEANRGQTNARVDFISRGPSYTLFLTPTAAVVTLQKPKTVAVSMRLLGANPHPQSLGQDQLPGQSNYFIGNDPRQWHTAIPTFSKVTYVGAWPGIDVVYYGNQRQLEYDFVVAPRADPRAIQLAIEGCRKLRIDRNGDLLLQTEDGGLRLQKPVVYQEIDGTRRAVAGRFAVRSKNEVGFELGRYDRAAPLVVDPILSYSTYLGPAGSSNGIAVDSAGNAYVTGQAPSSNFPTTPGAFQTNLAAGTAVAFVSKLNPTGSALVYSTYLGGSFNDSGAGIAVDSAGNAYVTGLTQSSNFPTTPGAFQTNKASGTNGSDAFVTKLNPTGSALVYSTYLGGGGVFGTTARGIAIDSAGHAYVTGSTASANFPTTPGAFQTALMGTALPLNAFVTKFNPTGSALVYSTYLGGSGSYVSVSQSPWTLQVTLTSQGTLRLRTSRPPLGPFRPSRPASSMHS